MAINTRLQFVRGTTAANDAFAGRPGELTVDTETWEIRVHDGSTLGGTEMASKSYVDTTVDTSINNLIGGAISTLDTLNELAAAINDDPDYFNTVTASINDKFTTTDFDSTFDARLDLKSTSDIDEGSNLYFTTARANQAFDNKVLLLTSSDIAEGGSNLYYTTARVNQDVDNRLAAKTTSNLVEGTNLYYTAGRVTALVDSTYVQARQDKSFGALTGTPTTLAGYGITDAVLGSSISTFGATLVDDADAATARATLGLGTAATTAATAYATSAQGASADTAFGWGNHAGAGYLTSETNTSLSINANTLTYTDELGVETDIDLSLYLDDTNLSRLTSGSLNAGTGIATFTRDDSSTFTVDFSALIDIKNVVDDATPQLGGNLDANGYIIDMGTNTITDTKVGNWDTAFGWGNHAGAGYLTTETNDLTSSVTWANVPDINITSSSVTQHQGNLSITESQISDLSAEVNDLTSSVTWANVPDINITSSSVTQHQGNLSILESQISDLGNYLMAEVNDLTSAVTWANVPDINITSSSVTQHQGNLSISQSQITDLEQDRIISPDGNTQILLTDAGVLTLFPGASIETGLVRSLVSSTLILASYGTNGLGEDGAVISINDTGVTIASDITSGVGSVVWEFNKDGTVTFPDASIQTTAFTGEYTPTTAADWNNDPPATIQAALDRIAAAIGPIT